MLKRIIRIRIVLAIDGERDLRIAGDYLGAFYDRTLRGRESPLPGGSSPPHPEVEFQPGR